ncbi:hypothetical protein ACLMJK_000520 [Lecanora helva]
MASWDNEPKGSMTAAVLTSPGAEPPSKCFNLDHDYPKPSLPGPNWVLVRVKAAGLNRAELRSRKGDRPGISEFGIFRSEYHEDPPKILGEEFVGVVEVAGRSTTFEQGDHVAGWVYGGGKAHDGAYAQYTICHSLRCFKIPPTTIDWVILGGIFMSMWIAWGSLFSAAQIMPGSTVLVHGATSSVGLWAVLLARDHGCTVFATTRKQEKIEKLTQAGADHVVLEENLDEELKRIAPKGVDCILELLGPDALPASLQKLRMHGIVVVTGILRGWGANTFLPTSIPATRKVSFYSTTSDDEALETIPSAMNHVIKRVEKNLYPSNIFLDKVFALEDIGKAHEYMEDNKAVGKVVVKMS